MRDSKIIIVTGMSGTGKSSISQQLAKQYELNNIPCRWLHEEIENHPIRKEGEFAIDRLDTEEGMKKNITEMLSRWRALVDEIVESGRVYIMEGCFYQSIIRYFFASNYTEDQIKAYYSEVLEILKPLRPTLVFLYRSQVKESFQQAFEVPGNQWKKIILEWEDEGYFKHHPFAGEESVYAMWEHYQRLSNEHFDQYQGYKIKLFTADGQWHHHLHKLTEYMGLSYFRRNFPEVENPEQYAGDYVFEENGQKHILRFKFYKGALCGETSWWTNMALVYQGNHEFEVLSFPIRYIFDPDKSPKTVTIVEDYGWSLSGKTFIKKE